ncbi:MAG TPA: UbiA family prenyltransferase, partial [Verrucomicrobiae bacterium]|nr:UbiA family prenyltransferase [Verrucomicrobiae bacterium]
MSASRRFRTLLALGRISNLPTVWSNCLAAWWLGGGRLLPFSREFGFVLAGASLLYTGGMFLNDAFDVEFDRQYRKERPIPSGAISLNSVWTCGAGAIAVGCALLFAAGSLAGLLGLLLAAFILAYNAVHKKWRFGPLLMAACRVCLYLVATAAAANRVRPLAALAALVMGFYIMGLSFVARRESAGGPVRYCSLLALSAPWLLALFRMDPGYREKGLLLLLVPLLWTIKSLRYAFGKSNRNVGQAVCGLLAGIVLVDWLAVATAPREVSFVFIGLFLLALGLQ